MHTDGPSAAHAASTNQRDRDTNSTNCHELTNTLIRDYSRERRRLAGEFPLAGARTFLSDWKVAAPQKQPKKIAHLFKGEWSQ